MSNNKRFTYLLTNSMASTHASIVTVSGHSKSSAFSKLY